MPSNDKKKELIIFANHLFHSADIYKKMSWGRTMNTVALFNSHEYTNFKIIIILWSSICIGYINQMPWSFLNQYIMVLKNN